jgi:predicted porin
MQKKIIALAIAAAISAPAFADNANVTVYGKAILDIESVSNDKATLSGATRVQTNASRLGFKGKEDLGDGLSGWYQYEVQLDADGNSANGAGNGTRNSGVGLEGGFGTVMLGVWDTPFKLAHNKVELFDNTTVFSAINLIGHAGGAAGANYNTRRSNDVQYWSPSLGGVKVNVSFSPDEGNNGASSVNAQTNRSQTSLSAVYDVEDIYVALGYEARPDASIAATTDSGIRAVGRYSLGDAWLGATWEGIKVNTSATASYTQNNFEVVGGYKLGSSTIGLSYAKAGETATAATGASQVSLRYGYGLSKRTELFAAYTSLKNDTAGAYGFSAGSTWGTNAGSTQSAFGTGLIVSF